MTFDEFYENFYGARWLEIKAALLKDSVKWAWCNPHAKLENLEGELQAQFEELRFVRWQKGEATGRREVDGGSVLSHYILDPASCQVACALAPKPGMDVVDLCAAPGGKSLLLMNLMQGQGRLVSNEFSSSRRENLKRILTQYFPRAERDFLFVKGADAQKYGLKEPDSFDAVLADVPCSGERHLLQSSVELQQWRPARSKGLAVRQYSILSSAFLCLREMGRLVYSTCSLSSLENDQVVAKILKRRAGEIWVRKDLIRWLTPEIQALAEETEHGYAFLPDRAGFGPMYFSVMIKSKDKF